MVIIIIPNSVLHRGKNSLRALRDKFHALVFRVGEKLAVNRHILAKSD
jgi:hypothetical protein